MYVCMYSNHNIIHQTSVPTTNNASVRKYTSKDYNVNKSERVNKNTTTGAGTGNVVKMGRNTPLKNNSNTHVNTITTGGHKQSSSLYNSVTAVGKKTQARKLLSQYQRYKHTRKHAKVQGLNNTKSTDTTQKGVGSRQHKADNLNNKSKSSLVNLRNLEGKRRVRQVQQETGYESDSFQHNTVVERSDRDNTQMVSVFIYNSGL